MTDLSHVVMFSGGVGSWAAAKRVAAKFGTERLWLLFMDTLCEDEDLYRFIDEAAANVGGQFVRIAEGRDPWQVFFDQRMMGNSRIDPCSKILKRQLASTWLRQMFAPADVVIHVGIDWTEEHRFKGGRGKSRRVEPGLRLLAHGVPARVAKLRAFGNAIVPQVAAEIIAAYLETEALINLLG